MTAHELLTQLRAKGVELKTSGDDRLVIDAPKGTVTEELRSALAAHKIELLEILKSNQPEIEPPVVSQPAATQPVISQPAEVAPTSAANEAAPVVQPALADNTANAG